MRPETKPFETIAAVLTRAPIIQGLLRRTRTQQEWSWNR